MTSEEEVEMPFPSLSRGSIGCMTLGALHADAPSDGGHCYPHIRYDQLSELCIQIPDGPVMPVSKATDEQFLAYIERLLQEHVRSGMRERVRGQIMDGIAPSEPLDEVARFYILDNLASNKAVRSKLFVV